MLSWERADLGDPWWDVPGVALGCCLCPSGGDRVLVLRVPPLPSIFPVLAARQGGCRGSSGKGIASHRAGNFGVSPPLGPLSQPWGWAAPWVPHPTGAAPMGDGSGAVGIWWRTTWFGFLQLELLPEAKFAITLHGVSLEFTALGRQEGRATQGKV